jgi:hypothetical protein
MADIANVKLNGISYSVKDQTARDTAGNAASVAANAKNAADAATAAVAGKQDTITGAATTITSSNLAASRALISNGSGKVAVSAVTSTELGYLDGVTSKVQTQLDAKQGTVSGAATTIVDDDLTASRALVSDASGKVDVSAVTDTELGYLDGVTSKVQTQLDSKVDAPTGEISMYFTTCAGQVTGSSKRVYFFVPIQGVASGATITFGGVWNIRGVSGNILTNGSLDSLGTVSYVIRTLGIDVRISLSSAPSVTNNTPCVVQGGTGATMTIS